MEALVMRISTPLVDVKDQLITLISEGFNVLGHAFTWSHDTNAIVRNEQEWRNKVYVYLSETFPTTKEAGQFLHTPGHELMFNSNQQTNNAINGMNIRLKVLENILDSLEKYYQFEPESLGVDIQHIDSFEKVRGVNHRDIEPYVNNGFFNRDEGTIKRAFAEIIGESFVPKDWGGETEDLFTSRTLLNAQRVSTSIIFNGPGKIKSSQTRLSDLGKRGDQLVRMMSIDTAKLYIMQSVKRVHPDVTKTLEALVEQQRNRGNHCHYCIIDGQDTATILYAYGYLN
jgi:hypothetical protein